MKYKALIIALAMLPTLASAQFMGHSEYDPTTGGYRYYNAPSAGMEDAAAFRNALQGLQQLQQAKQFQRQIELSERIHEDRMRLLREESERREEAHNSFMHELGILKDHRDAGRVEQHVVDNLIRGLLSSNLSTEEQTFRMRTFNSTISE